MTKDEEELALMESELLSDGGESVEDIVSDEYPNSEWKRSKSL